MLEQRPLIHSNQIISIEAHTDGGRNWPLERGSRDSDERLRQIRKMEVAGRFAGGIAHDLNNILTVIVGSSQLVLDHPEVGREAGQRVQQILDARFRAAKLTSQLLSFSRKQAPRNVSLNLNRIIADSADLIRFLIGDRIGLTTLLAPDLPNVSADPMQMEQVLMNLCLNARDAMPDGGSIAIESQFVEVNGDNLAENFPMKPGRYVRLCVRDTATGMDEATLEHAFEPFFTTKSSDGGMGLGLATVQCIVTYSGGYVRGESRPGEGPVFSVFLPVTEDVAGPALRGLHENVCGTETVLLAEESAEVHEARLEFLKGLGYTVFSAEDAEGAMQTLRRHPEISALITDNSIPGMERRTLVERLRDEQPDLKVLQITAPPSGFVNHGFPDANTAFLRKPFTPEMLARRLRHLIEGRGEALQ